MMVICSRILAAEGVRSGKILNIFWSQSQEDFLIGYGIYMGESKIGRMRDGGQLFF